MGLVGHLSRQPHRNDLVPDSLVCPHEIHSNLRQRRCGGDHFGGIVGGWNLCVGRLEKQALVRPLFFFAEDNYDDLYSSDYCEEKSWFAVALVCAILWAGAAVCMLVFVKSGRHAKWESKHTPAEMELAASAVVPEQQQQAVVENVAVKVLESEKVDETV